MDRRVVSDRELDLLAIDHVECLQLGIVLREILERTLLEDRLAIGRANRDHRLEQPCGIAVLLRLHLLVDEKQRDQTRIADRTRHIAHNADEILADAFVGTVSGNLPLGKVNDLLAAERDTLPAIEWLARLGMHDELALRPVIAAPRHLNLNVGKRGVDAECQSHGRRHQRAGTGDIKSVGHILFRLLLGNVRSRRLRLVMLSMILVAVLVFVGRFSRLLNLFVRRGGASRTVNPARSQPPKNVAVANAHPDDLLLRPLRGTKQIVRDNGF